MQFIITQTDISYRHELCRHGAGQGRTGMRIYCLSNPDKICSVLTLLTLWNSTKGRKKGPTTPAYISILIKIPQ